MYLEKAHAHSTPKVIQVHMASFTPFYFFQMAYCLLGLYQDQNKDNDIILNSFLCQNLLNAKLIQICSFFTKLFVRSSRNYCQSSSDMWFFKLQLFKRQILHIFVISHINFGSQEKTANRWSICSPERSRSTDWSLPVMVCRVRIAKDSKVGNAWKIKYF